MFRATPRATATATAIVRAGRFEGGLQTRIVGRAESIPSPSWIALLLAEGQASFQGAQAEVLQGPRLAWRPWGQAERLTLAPGSVGAYVLIGATALANAVGYKPESRELRDMADRVFSVPVARDSRSFGRYRTCFEAIHGETRDEGAAARTLIEAYLRILLVELWRTQPDVAPGADRTAPSQRLFNRFTTLVELHFRERWTVARYAQALGMSRDRLGDVCRRVRGHSPKTLLDRRMVLEARLLLENSTNSVEQIADLLGFQSAAQFNRYFRRTMGQPPGRFRAEAGRSGAAPLAGETAQLHEWP